MDKSHPSRMCGLKCSSIFLEGGSLCRTLRGCVDYNVKGNGSMVLPAVNSLKVDKVAPFMVRGLKS